MVDVFRLLNCSIPRLKHDGSRCPVNSRSSFGWWWQNGLYVINTKMRTYTGEDFIPFIFSNKIVFVQIVFQINLAFKYLEYFYHVLRHLNYDTFYCFLNKCFYITYAGKQTGQSHISIGSYDPLETLEFSCTDGLLYVIQRSH